MNHFQFKLPDLGEGLTEAKIQCWHVNENDIVTQDQLLVTVETDKTLVDIPVLQNGKIVKINFPSQSLVKVGQTICTIAFESASSIVGQIPSAHAPSAARKPKKNYKIHPKALMLAKSKKIDEQTLIKMGQGQRMIMEADILAHLASPAKKTAMAKISSSSLHRATSSIIDHALIPNTNALTARILTAIYRSMREISLFETHRICMAVDDDQQTLLISPPPTSELAEAKKLISQIKCMRDDKKFPQQWLSASEVLLSNFGTISGRYGFPILPDNVEIAFGIGTAFTENEKLTLPVTIIFDHSQLTGGQVARLLKSFKDQLLT